jgi:ABC-type transport system involved in multi-copper enzyme maturation permease subunit
MSHAVTHQEVYRPLPPEERPGTAGRRVGPLVAAGIRACTRRKIPLALVYAPPLIGTIVFSFGIQAGLVAGELGAEVPLAKILSVQAERLLMARKLVVQYNTVLSTFALFAVAWYGSGLLCEDRRAGAHQLYFARPLTRPEYLLAKFLTTAFFGALALLVPGLILCFVAVWAAPGWSFLREEWDVVLRTLAYGLVWTVFMSSLTLCASSLFPRRSLAFAALIGATMVLEPVGHLFGEVFHEGWIAIAPLQNLVAISLAIFDAEERIGPAPAVSASVLVGLVLVALATAAWRTRRLEVVA